MRTRYLPAITLSLLFLTPAGAETVYKSVDAEGNVTYSSTPPPASGSETVETVPIAPPPPEAQRREAEERARALETESARLDRERQEQKQQTAATVDAAERELHKARMALEQASIRGDGDWQTLVTGGRVPTQSYLDRVEQAKQVVRQAEEAVRKARGGGR